MWMAPFEQSSLYSFMASKTFVKPGTPVKSSSRKGLDTFLVWAFGDSSHIVQPSHHAFYAANGPLCTVVSSWKSKVSCRLLDTRLFAFASLSQHPSCPCIQCGLQELAHWSEHLLHVIHPSQSWYSTGFESTMESSPTIRSSHCRRTHVRLDRVIHILSGLSSHAAANLRN